MARITCSLDRQLGCTTRVSSTPFVDLKVPSTSNYFPRVWFAWSELPLTLEKLLSFMISISAALGLLNLAPIFYLDGAYACSTLAQCFFPQTRPETRDRVCKLIFYFTSGLMVVNTLASFANL